MKFNIFYLKISGKVYHRPFSSVRCGGQKRVKCRFLPTACAMNLTFAVSLPEWPSEHLSAAPALAAMLRFGRFAAAPASSAAFYARTLWRGSLCRLLAAEAGLPDGTPCVLAAPVSQQMGMNQAHQACGRTLGITPDEAAAWCAGLTEFFADAGWRFHPCRPDLWLLSLPQQPGWQDVPSVWAVPTGRPTAWNAPKVLRRRTGWPRRPKSKCGCTPIRSMPPAPCR
ncbi:hypothetical protein [Kingella potus]|uniref:hypothetical protein n=1 Tax=Kingella potus TaxID=265175 RepID=UPI001FD161D1|nr:hypothetical protein [Kingella potus]UOP00829.1 hypothetical protein LVJ84_13995 [Kingella potus]